MAQRMNPAGLADAGLVLGGVVDARGRVDGSSGGRGVGVGNSQRWGRSRRQYSRSCSSSRGESGT